MNEPPKIYPLTPAGMRLARESAGLTPREAAVKLKISGQALRTWEAGGYPPTIKNVSPLAKLYRCTFYVDETTARMWPSLGPGRS